MKMNRRRNMKTAKWSWYSVALWQTLMEITINIYFNMFCEKLPALRKKFNSWNSRKIYEREKYLNVFSTENWKQLMHERKPSTALWIEKAASTDMSSSPCFQWHPGNSLAVKRLARCLLLRIFHRLLIHHLLWNAPKEKLRSTLKPYSTVNIPFNQALTKVRKLDLDTKKSKTDKKTERRDCYRKSKACLEEHWKKTSVMR